jgi:glyoxylase I family protein
MFTGIEHFAIASPDPRKLAEWYVAHLAFHISHEYAGNYFVKAPNGVVIEIIPATGERGENARQTPGMRHIAVSVDSFDAAHAELKNKGVTFDGEPYVNSGNRLVFFQDADGNQVHLIERATPLP